MEPGEALTRWTVRVAFLCYIAALGLRIRAGHDPVRWGAARWPWSVGAFLFLVHVICAFHFYHHWSHAAAYQATAQRTAEVVKFHWGGGLYLNYAFTLLWVADAAWWWCGLDGYLNRPRWVNWSVQAFMAFMFFNATVVFGHGWIVWMAGAGLGFLLWRMTQMWTETAKRRPRGHD